MNATTPTMNRTRRLPKLTAGLTAALMLAVIGIDAAADGREQGFQMKAVADRNHGDLVLDERYDAAITRNRTWAQAIRQNPDRLVPFAVANNLCVAYTMGGRQHEAQPYCDAAVRAAAARAELNGKTIEQDTAHWAIALSNRGVQKALNDDEAGARDDFRQAMLLEADVSVVADNLVRLDNGDDNGLGNIAQQVDID